MPTTLYGRTTGAGARSAVQDRAGTRFEADRATMGNAVATLPPSSEGPGPRCSIAHTEKGWLLVIRDEQCSVMQVFSTLNSAQTATDRMYAFFEDMRDQGTTPPQAPAV
jgi:hypothetical protein